MFPSVILKSGLVVSKEVTSNIHFPSSERFIGGEKEKSVHLFVV